MNKIYFNQISDLTAKPDFDVHFTVLDRRGLPYTSGPAPTVKEVRIYTIGDGLDYDYPQVPEDMVTWQGEKMHVTQCVSYNTLKALKPGTIKVSVTVSLSDGYTKTYTTDTAYELSVDQPAWQYDFFNKSVAGGGGGSTSAGNPYGIVFDKLPEDGSYVKISELKIDHIDESTIPESVESTREIYSSLKINNVYINRLPRDTYRMSATFDTMNVEYVNVSGKKSGNCEAMFANATVNKIDGPITLAEGAVSCRDMFYRFSGEKNITVKSAEGNIVEDMAGMFKNAGVMFDTIDLSEMSTVPGPNIENMFKDTVLKECKMPTAMYDEQYQECVDMLNQNMIYEYAFNSDTHTISQTGKKPAWTTFTGNVDWNPLSEKVPHYTDWNGENNINEHEYIYFYINGDTTLPLYLNANVTVKYTVTAERIGDNTEGDIRMYIADDNGSVSEEVNMTEVGQTYTVSFVSVLNPNVHFATDNWNDGRGVKVLEVKAEELNFKTVWEGMDPAEKRVSVNQSGNIYSINYVNSESDLSLSATDPLYFDPGKYRFHFNILPEVPGAPVEIGLMDIQYFDWTDESMSWSNIDIPVAYEGNTPVAEMDVETPTVALYLGSIKNSSHDKITTQPYLYISKIEYIEAE